MFKAAIFDLDGTLLDSMHIWSNLCQEFLKKHGIDQPVDLEKKLEVLSIRNALQYVLEVFPDIRINLDEACSQTWQIVEEFYCSKVQIKPGIPEILDELKKNNIPAGIITATEYELVVKALERVGLREYFGENIISCASQNTSKRTPEVFLSMADKFHAAPGEVIVFEDALYASETAKKAGFCVAAVFDPSEKHPDELRSLADSYCHSWTEFSLSFLTSRP